MRYSRGGKVGPSPGRLACVAGCVRPEPRGDLAEIAFAGDGEGLEHVLVRARQELVHVHHHLPHQHPPLPCTAQPHASIWRPDPWKGSYLRLLSTVTTRARAGSASGPGRYRPAAQSPGRSLQGGRGAVALYVRFSGCALERCRPVNRGLACPSHRQAAPCGCGTPSSTRAVTAAQRDAEKKPYGGSGRQKQDKDGKGREGNGDIRYGHWGKHRQGFKKWLWRAWEVTVPAAASWTMSTCQMVQMRRVCSVRACSGMTNLESHT
jgi:hypothetical protein